jgi:hypothetical protein
MLIGRHRHSPHSRRPRHCHDLNPSSIVHGLEDKSSHTLNGGSIDYLSPCPGRSWYVLICSRVLQHSIVSAFPLDLAGGIWTTVVVAIEPSFTAFMNFRLAPTLWLVSSAVTDIAITISLAYTLVSLIYPLSKPVLTSLSSRHRRRPVFQRQTTISATSSSVCAPPFVLS